MEKTRSVTSVRKDLMNISKRASIYMDRVVLTNKGQAESILLGMADYLGLKAAAELAAHPEVIDAMRRSQQAFAAGEGVSLEDAFRRLEHPDSSASPVVHEIPA
jgi:PHD/YefM family antitoxin component YafN of YafNO toxin-antitoxin module